MIFYFIILQIRNVFLSKADLRRIKSFFCKRYKQRWNIVKKSFISAVIGHCVGDALGVPVEFYAREILQKKPVRGMRAQGTHNQPAGTWSDDSSMMLCLIDALAKSHDGHIDYQLIMKNFYAWYTESAFSPYQETFDIGNATRRALNRFQQGTLPLACGGSTDRDNGNGSLMRILPMAFFLYPKCGANLFHNDTAVQQVHNVSMLTHAHGKSCITCGIYINIALKLLANIPLKQAIVQGVSEAFLYYSEQPIYRENCKYYTPLLSNDFKKTPENLIESSGYVVHTLFSVLWCLLNTRSYKGCVIKAVNLGGDTDTIAAIAGGLAGLAYGYEAIPRDWLEILARKDWIIALCGHCANTIMRGSLDKLFLFLPELQMLTAPASEGNHHCEIAQSFIETIYDNNIIVIPYLEEIEKYNHTSCGKEFLSKKFIETSDMWLLRVALTALVRQDRFFGGVLDRAFEDDIFYTIIERLEKLSRI